MTDHSEYGRVQLPCSCPSFEFRELPVPELPDVDYYFHFRHERTLRPQSGRRACPVGRPIAADRVHASRRSHGTAIPIPGEPPHAATWKSRTLTFFQANCPSGSISAGQGRHETAGSVAHAIVARVGPRWGRGSTLQTAPRTGPRILSSPYPESGAGRSLLRYGHE